MIHLIFYQQLENKPDEKLSCKLRELQESPTKRIKYDLPLSSLMLMVMMVVMVMMVMVKMVKA